MTQHNPTQRDRLAAESLCAVLGLPKVRIDGVARSFAHHAAETREECARIAERTTAYDDMVQQSAGCATTGQRIAAAIRESGRG